MIVKKRNFLYILITTILLFVIAYILFGNSNKERDVQITQSLIDKSTQIDAWLSHKKSVIIKLSKDLENVKYDKESHLKLMNIANTKLQTNSIFSGFKNGKYFDTQGYWIGGFDPRTRPWFKQTINSNRATITGPMHYNDVSGKKIIWWGISYPFMQNNKPFGVVSGEILPDMLRNFLKELLTKDVEHIFIYNKNTGLVISAINENKELKKIQNIFPKKILDKFTKTNLLLYIEEEGVLKSAYINELKEVPWKICIIWNR